VRELENVLERAVMFSSGDEIDPEALSGFMGAGGVLESDATPAMPVPVPSHDVSQLAQAAARGILATTAVPGVFRVEPVAKPPEPVAKPPEPVPTPRAGQVPANARPSVASEQDEGWLTLADVERLHLERTLAVTMQNKSLAAKMLGIDRSVLRRKLQRYGLEGQGGPEQGSADDAGQESAGP
jgi:DNA-binding NtrC family response regulator